MVMVETFKPLQHAQAESALQSPDWAWRLLGMTCAELRQCVAYLRVRDDQRLPRVENLLAARQDAGER